MFKFNIVVIEDEAHISKAVKQFLEDEGYNVHTAGTLKEGQIECATRKPDLIVLDLGLPDGDGIALIRTVRGYSNIPIIVLSARDSEVSKVQALDAGADDYLTKPFGVSELLARIRAHLRRFSRSTGISGQDFPDEVVLKQGVRVDLLKHMVYKRGEQLHLTKLEFRLLQAFIQEPNKLLTHQYLLQKVWGASYVEHQHYLRIYMAHLRQKLEDNPADPVMFITDIGLGYRLNTEDPEDE